MSERRRCVAVLGTAWVLASAGLLAAGGARWWTYVAPEQSPMTWLQSVVLVLAAAAALLVGLGSPARAGTTPPRTGWWLLGGGLGALAVDERFALHERLRDRVLAPLDVGPHLLPWVAPGDVVLLAVALGGLAVLPLVWRSVRPDRGSARALVLAVALSSLAVLADSVDPARWGTDGERWEQTIEEVVELAAGLGYLAAAALPLIGLVLRASEAAANR